MKTTTRKTLRVRDIPPSWEVELPDDPDAPVTVWISPAETPSGRRLVDYIGSGQGIYRNRAGADAYIGRLRQEWQD